MLKKKCLIGGVAFGGSGLIRRGLLYIENNNICLLLFDCVIISVFYMYLITSQSILKIPFWILCYIFIEDDIL